MPSHTTLMFGSHYDGELVKVPHPGEPWFVAEAPKPSLISFAGDPFDDLTIRRVAYLPREIVFFDTLLLVHVQEGWPKERLNAQLADHLLSDKAKAVIR